MERINTSEFNYLKAKTLNTKHLRTKAVRAQRRTIDIVSKLNALNKVILFHKTNHNMLFF